MIYLFNRLVTQSLFSKFQKDFFLISSNKVIFILMFRIFNLETSSEYYKFFQDNHFCIIDRYYKYNYDFTLALENKSIIQL